ncbi:group 3 secretory phospholipase A2-like isoform X2 [Conger conger]|uniref:group 3 secretory phospholipase A2-like isoform X2 n=1 Tax=Conger conger TaxID=82655 RepID=UPI002A5AFDDD|nr:group 3 secretory phospholipase A2-like isoform X2 [Conger conger]
MQIRSELHLIIFLALYNFSTASDGTSALTKTDPRNANLCSWISATGGRVHYGFLRQSAGTLRLYLSTWTESQRLVDCVIIQEREVTESYLSLCQEKRAADFSGNLEERFNTSLLLAPGSPCVLGSVAGFEPSVRLTRDLEDADLGRASLRNPAVSSGPELRRRKRAWIFPGTLWCGMGSKANAYDDIGLFEKADRCCREHDHCSHTIRAFRVNYGVFNSNFFTVSHCECDLRFRQCLQGENDTIANMVGYSFFNMMKVPCFTFIQKKHCTQLNWCKAVEVAPYAVFSYPTPYNSTQLVQVVEGAEVTAVPTSPAGERVVSSSSASHHVTSPARNSTTPRGRGNKCPLQGGEPKTSTPRGRCGAKGPARGDTFLPSQKTSGSGKRRKANVLTASPVPRTTTTSTTTSSTTTTSTTTTSTPTTHRAVVRKTTPLHAGKSGGSKNALPSDLPWAPPKHAVSNLPAPVKGSRHKGKLQLCDCYKQLDECQHKILPHEEKYGIRNVENKILYHCNCTRGLSQQLRQLSDSSALLQSLLLDFVSLSCFKGLHLADCLQRRRCRAVLSESKHLTQTLKRLGVPEVIRDPAGATPKVKRRNSRKVKRGRGKSTPVRFYNRCLRITSKLE